MQSPDWYEHADTILRYTPQVGHVHWYYTLDDSMHEGRYIRQLLKLNPNDIRYLRVNWWATATYLERQISKIQADTKWTRQLLILHFRDDYAVASLDYELLNLLTAQRINILAFAYIPPKCDEDSEGWFVHEIEDDAVINESISEESNDNDGDIIGMDDE
jgi:hypothetical protein